MGDKCKDLTGMLDGATNFESNITMWKMNE